MIAPSRSEPARSVPSVTSVPSVKPARPVMPVMPIVPVGSIGSIGPAGPVPVGSVASVAPVPLRRDGVRQAAAVPAVASSTVPEATPATVPIADLVPGESPRLHGQEHVARLAEVEGPLPPILVDRRTIQRPRLRRQSPRR